LSSPSSVTLRIKEVRNKPRLSRRIKWLELIHFINQMLKQSNKLEVGNISSQDKSTKIEGWIGQLNENYSTYSSIHFGN
jgi:hypothetical protein